MVWCCVDSLVVCPVRVVEKMLRPSGVVVCDKFLNVPSTYREIMGSGKLSTCGTCPLTYSPLSVVVEEREVEYLAASTVRDRGLVWASYSPTGATIQCRENNGKCCHMRVKLFPSWFRICRVFG